MAVRILHKGQFDIYERGLNTTMLDALGSERCFKTCHCQSHHRSRWGTGMAGATRPSQWSARDRGAQHHRRTFEHNLKDIAHLGISFLTRHHGLYQIFSMTIAGKDNTDDMQRNQK